MRAMNGEKSMRTSLARKMTQASAVPQLFSRPVRQPSNQANEEAPALGLATKNKCYFIASIKNKEHVVLMLVVEVILCWSIFFCIGTYGNHRPMKELKRKDFIFFLNHTTEASTAFYMFLAETGTLSSMSEQTNERNKLYSLER
jgi:hypothetical protein